MKTGLIWLKALCCVIFAFALGGCSSSDDSSSSSNAGSGGSSVGTAGSSSAGTGGSAGMAGSATMGGAAGTGGSAGSGGSSNAFVYFVTQGSANPAPTAALADGTISVSSTFGASGNAFKYVAPNYYGTVSNGFISFPTAMTGDFSITAQINVSAQNKANNACGIGLGMTTGFAGTDKYGYILMRNQNNSTSGYFVSGSGTTSAGSPTVPFTNGTALQLSFSRTGSSVSYSASPVGGTATTQTASATSFTDGTTVYGTGPVYPAISFNNVTATIANLVIKDGSGATVFDSATGSLVPYVPASLTLSTPSIVYLNKGDMTTITATAVGIGGAVANVTAVAADPTVVGVTVANGATNSTVTVNGLTGGVSDVTFTNTADTNAATNTKTVTISVADYPATDGYGALTTAAYPAPGATNAYTDGELALTFDAPPTLNKGGTIRIFKQSDGTQVDIVAFANETNTYGTTTINVGSQLARVAGNTVFFAPHLGKLTYGTAYYVAIPSGAITGTLNTVAFSGLSNLSTVATWKFSTRAAPTLSATNVTVDGSQTGSANFRTIQGALGSLATMLPTATNVTVNVAAGSYNELVHYTGPGSTTPTTITISGPAANDHGANCVVQFANGNNVNGSTATRASFYFSGANLVLQNITLKNTGVRATVSQAESLYFASGAGFTVAAHNSSFFSNQDTIQTSGRAWFYDCHVEGNVDFIWGTSDAALVENSTLRFVYDLASGTATYGLFVARTGTTIPAAGNGTVGKGYVLLNSSVSVDANVTAYFGRDAGTGAFYDQAALIGVTFSGAGTIGAGRWNVGTLPLSLGDSSYVGWKSAGCTGLNLATDTTDTHTSATIANQDTEYDTRDHILNRVVTVTAGAPAGFQAAATTWDFSALASAWGAP
ncbi:MAG TPA: pectinesterase family protein [Polyangiaceae bacterium]|nr:pectinesterase family protein [Polyangiaceae bacterium]